FADLPGYGGTPLMADFSAAADALAACLPLGGDLIGWSLGGMLALAVAARHPDKVGRLVLIAGTASFVARDDWPDAMPPAELDQFIAAAQADMAALLPRFVANFNRGERRARALTREILAMGDPLPAQEALAIGLNWLRTVDLRPLMPTVRCPTLILHGAEDPLMPLAGARRLASILPDARLEVLPGCAHAPFLSAPEAFLAHLEGFRP
ncbi:MAG: alpha/beta fold hydrolase, partial [Betaproteobacteria bacterium]